MATKPVNYKEVLQNLLYFLQDETDPDLKKLEGFLDITDLQRFAKEDPEFLELLKKPSEGLIDELRDVYRSALVGETTDVLGSVRGSLKGAKGAAPIASAVDDLIPSAIKSPIEDFYTPDYTGRGPTREYVGFKPPKGAVIPEGTMGPSAGSIRRRGETAPGFRGRVEAAGRAASPGLALTPEQAFQRGASGAVAPAKPRLPDTSKGTFGRNLKARLLNLRRGFKSPVAKMGLVGGGLASLGAYFTLMELLGGVQENVGRPAATMSRGLQEGFGSAVEAMGTPSPESVLEESRALREIATAGTGNVGLSRELQDLVNVTDKELQFMRQRVNPTMREAYARAGLL